MPFLIQSPYPRRCAVKRGSARRLCLQRPVRALLALQLVDVRIRALLPLRLQQSVCNHTYMSLTSVVKKFGLKSEIDTRLMNALVRYA